MLYLFDGLIYGGLYAIYGDGVAGVEHHDRLRLGRRHSSAAKKVIEKHYMVVGIWGREIGDTSIDNISDFFEKYLGLLVGLISRARPGRPATVSEDD